MAVLRALSAPFLHAPPPSSSEHLLLQALLVRVRDVDANVRVAAVDAVTRLVRVEALTVTQRVRVLDAVLLDDAAAVRGKSAALLHAWLRDVRDDVFALLRALEPTVHEATAERVSAALAALVPCVRAFTSFLSLAHVSFLSVAWIRRPFKMVNWTQ